MIPALAALTTLLLAPPQEPPRIEPPSLHLIQRGTSVRLRLQGAHLGEARSVLFAAARGVRARIGAADAAGLILQLSAAPDAPAGPRELRVATPHGVSNNITIHVGTLPVRTESEPNDTPDQAQSLQLPVALCGSIHAATQRDLFAFDAGTTPIEIRVAARSIGSPLDPVLTVLDARNRPVAWGRAALRPGDVTARFQPPRPGRYRLQLRDLRYRGGKQFRYQIHATRAERTGSEPPVVFPLAGQAGQVVEVEVRGQPVTLDLSRIPPGAERVRLPDAGPMQTIPFAVVSSPTAVEDTSIDPKASPPTPLALPAHVSGRILEAGEVDRYRLRLPQATEIRCAVRCEEFLSPLDPLLELFDARGRRIAVADDTGRSRDATIQQKLGPGDYEIRVRSLVRQGSGAHVYLLDLTRPAPARRDFTVRFLPDTPRVRRGSHTRMWCEVVRRNGFTAPVTLRFVDLPAGITIPPVTLSAATGWSQVFTASADRTAPLGPVPLRATAHAEAETTIRAAIPEAERAEVASAWLTVLPDAAFTVAPFGPADPEVKRRWQQERARLEAELSEADPELEAAVQAFLQAHRSHRYWETLAPDEIRARSGASFRTLEDGSTLAQGKTAPTDTYTFVATTTLDRLAAIRLDVLPDASTPTGGLGRAAGHGNFVLSRFHLAAAVGDGPFRGVKLHRPAARFSQGGYPVAHALDENPASGWAVAPQMSRANWAQFELVTPILAPSGTPIRLRVVLDQNHGSEHVLARFRLAVAGAPLKAQAPRISASTAAAARRDGAAAAKPIRDFAATTTPRYRRIRARLQAIAEGRGNDARIAALQAALREDTPERKKEREAWIRARAAKLPRWRSLQFHTLRSERGVRFLREPGDVIRARRPVANKDNFELIGHSPLPRITALRLETLPAADLKAGGAGLAETGNFVLTEVSLRTWPKGSPDRAQAQRLHDPTATFAQAGFPIDGTLDGSPRTGWAVYPQAAQPQLALWKLRDPNATRNPEGTVLRILLEHQSRHSRHQLGRFRLWVTDAPAPSLGEQDLPSSIALAITTPAPERTPRQRAMLVDHFRQLAPSLQPVRREIAKLRAEQSVYPPRTRQGGRTRLAVRLSRHGPVAAPIQVDLIGFSAGRDKNGAPNPISTDLKVTAVEVPDGTDWAILEIEAKPKAAIGTRPVLLRATTEIDGARVTEFSPVIPLTVLPRN